MKFRILPPLKSFMGSASYYLRGLYHRFAEEEVLFLSSGIAFNAILCLIPLLLLVTFSIGMILQGTHSSIHQQINNILDGVFPAQPYARQIRNALQGMIDDIVRYRSTFGVSGVIAFIWAATSLFSAVRTVLNRVYRSTTRKLAWIRMAENVVLVLLLTVLFVTANASSWLLQLIDSIIRDIPALDQYHLTPVARSVPFGFEFIPAFLMFFILNRYIPDAKVGTRVSVVSSVTSASLWWIAGRAFAWYLRAFHAYSKLYGTYAFLLVFLIWMYYSSVVFVVGSVIGQLYRERHSPPPA